MENKSVFNGLPILVDCALFIRVNHNKLVKRQCQVKRHPMLKIISGITNIITAVMLNVFSNLRIMFFVS